MIDMKKFLILFLLSFLLIAPARAQDSTIETQVDKTSLPLGQSLSLSIIYNNIQPPQADVSSLRGDFDVVGVAESTNINIINGKSSMQYVRKFRLIPKREGEIEIPAFDDGQGNLSQPIKINVVPAGTEVAAPISDKSKQDSAPSQQPQFSMTGRVNNNNPYVQQEIIYTVSLIDSGGLQGHEPVFELQNNQDWVIRSLGTPEILPLVVQGKKMREILFKYALFPQKSGKLTIPAVRFEGYTLSRPKKRIDPFADLFGDDLSSSLGFTFAEQNPVLLRTKPLEIDVKPVPESNNGNWWLPAESVELYSEWEPKNPKFMVGEAVSRTIYLKATGVVENQLPEIKFPSINGIKQYPEKPISESRLNNDKIVSIQKAVNVYIPNTEGNITLPEIRVPWFNVKTNRMEVASLPATTIKVAAGKNSVAEELSSGAPNGADSATVNNNTNSTPNAPLAASSGPSQSNNYQTYFMIAVAFFLGIVFSYLLLKSRLSPKDDRKSEIKDFRAYIIKKAQEKDLRGLRDGLFEWCEQAHPEQKVLNLREVIKFNPDKDFEQAINSLMKGLYADNAQDWDSESFIAAFEKVYKSSKGAQKLKKPLPELYQK